MNSMLLVSVLSMAGADAPVAAPAPLPVAAPVYSAPAMAAPIVVVGGAGCSNCGSSAPSYGGVTYAPSYSSYGSYGSSCGSAATCSTTRGFGILDRLRGRFASIGSRFAPSYGGGSCCPAPVATCAPVCAAPIATCNTGCGSTYAPVSTPLVGHALFTGMTSNVCDPCGRVGLLDRLRGIFRRPSWGASCTSGIVGGTGCCGSTSGYGDVVGTPIHTAPEYTPAPAPVVIPTPMPAPEPPKVMPKPEPTPDPKKVEPTTGPKTTQLTPKSPVIPTLGGTASNY